MRLTSRLLLTTGMFITSIPATLAAQAQQDPAPPVAKVIPQELVTHGHVRVDDYFWLRGRENPEVIAYLEAENAYTEAVMAHTETFQAALFEEMRARIDETDESVPYKLDDYWYYTRWEEGREYPIYARTSWRSPPTRWAGDSTAWDSRTWPRERSSTTSSRT